MEDFKGRFYDVRNLPLDPDTGARSMRSQHTDTAHVAVVASGAFFGTLARYEISCWMPAARGSWPTAIFLINVTGSFLLGFLIEALARRGKDRGGLRMLRLTLGTGFLGAFTTYSSFATTITLLAQSHHDVLAAAYAATSLTAGIACCALGITLAAGRNRRRDIV